MDIDLNNTRLLRQAEVAFVTGFHDITPCDTELAMSYGQCVIDIANDDNVNLNPVRTAGVLADIALFSASHDDIKSDEALSAGEKMLSDFKDGYSHQDIMQIQAAKELSKLHIVRQILSGDDPQPTIEALRTITDHQRKAMVARARTNTETPESRQATSERTGILLEHLTVSLFNLFDDPVCFLPTSDILNGPNMRLVAPVVEEATTVSEERLLGVDMVGIPMRDPRATPRLFQIKSSPNQVARFNELPYADHIAPVIWSNYVDRKLLDTIAQSRRSVGVHRQFNTQLQNLFKHANRAAEQSATRTGLVILRGTQPATQLLLSNVSRRSHPEFRDR
jgi:hypothetical protein